MPRVFIPPAMRSLTEGRDVIEVEGATVREVVNALDCRFAGMKDRLCQDGDLRPDLSVVVDGSVSALGLLESVQPDAEIHFLPALGGG